MSSFWFLVSGSWFDSLRSKVEPGTRNQEPGTANRRFAHGHTEARHTLWHSHADEEPGLHGHCRVDAGAGPGREHRDFLIDRSDSAAPAAGRAARRAGGRALARPEVGTYLERWRWLGVVLLPGLQ